MRFRGEYQHSVDSKGRVSLPAKFRKALPDEVTIVPVANADFGKALYVFSDEAYDEWMDSFFDTEEGGYNPRSKRHIALHKYLNSSAESVAVDAAGRVKLSPKQCEKVGIDKNVTMADLKGTLNTVVEQLYGKGTKTRFRPHHFPFTEPSCEMDVQCHKCGGVGCPTCKGEGWIELLGAGMVHPKVLAGCGIDPEIYSGFAFGIGLERMAMRRFKISDMRMIFENDIRFLSQF